MGYFILDDLNNPIEVDVDSASVWFAKNTHRQIVAFTEISKKCFLSTVFLTVNHKGSTKKPLLFESLWFGGIFDGCEIQYESWENAFAGHFLLVQQYRKASRNL